MDTKELVQIVRLCQQIAWNEGGGNYNGDMSAMIPLLEAALKNIDAPSIRRAILGYSPPEK